MQGWWLFLSEEREGVDKTEDQQKIVGDQFSIVLVFLDVSQCEVTWGNNRAKENIKVVRKNEESNEILILWQVWVEHQ